MTVQPSAPYSDGMALSSSGFLEHAATLLLSSTVLATAAIGGALLGSFGVASAFAWQRRKHKGAFYPRDWQPRSEWLARRPTDGSDNRFTTATTDEAIRQGMAPLGRTLPLFIPIPMSSWVPLAEARRVWIEWFSRPIFLSRQKRVEHIIVTGPTGRGKSTGFIYPWLAYDTLINCSDVVIDVKTPELFRVFSQPYAENGKRVLFFDPWLPHATLAYEPLYRASDAERTRLAQQIIDYIPTAEQVSKDSTAQFFEGQAQKVLRSLMDLADMWPRRYCNLPCIQQLVGLGGKAVLEAYSHAQKALPTAEAVLAAVERVLTAPADLLRGSRVEGRVVRDPDLHDALQLLDRMGFEIQRVVRATRQGDAPLPSPIASDVREQLRTALQRRLRARTDALRQSLININDFLQSAPETQNSTVNELANKLAPFAFPAVAAAFSRDELDIEALIREPSLLLIGAPLEEMQTGAGFVGSLLTKQLLKLLEGRPARVARNEPGIAFHPVYLHLDEFANLGLRNPDGPMSTLRSFNVGIDILIQDRGKMKAMYGETVTTIEANAHTQVVLPATHPETTQYIGETIMGKVRLVRRQKSRTSGKDGTHTINESLEEVPLMSGADINKMRINGRPRRDVALQINAPAAFPFIPVQYWNDPFIRGLLKMRREPAMPPDAPPTTRLRVWIERLRGRLEPTRSDTTYLTRRQFGMDEKRDPFADSLDFMLSVRPITPDALQAPVLDLKTIGVSEPDPDEQLRKSGGQTPRSSAPPPAAVTDRAQGATPPVGVPAVGIAGPSAGTEVVPKPLAANAVPGLVALPTGGVRSSVAPVGPLPRYSRDLKTLCDLDFDATEPPALDPAGAPITSIADRLALLRVLDAQGLVEVLR